MNTKQQSNGLLPVKVPFYYGWIILVLGAMGLFFSGPGQTYSISIFIDSYIANFGWSRSMVSGFYSIATLTAGLILPIIGRRIDHIGYRKMIAIIPILLGITCLWMSFTAKAWMLFIGFMFLRLFGQGSMTLIPNALIPQWFIRRRGLALSLMGLGGVMGSTLLPPVNNWLITNTSTQFTWQFWAILLIGLMAPLGWFLVRNRPEDIGLLPDGKVQKTDEEHLYTGPRIEETEHSWTSKEAVKTKSFWLILFCGTIPSMINTGLTFHMVSIIGEKGFDSTFAATLLSIIAMTQLPTTFVAGHVLDRVKPNHVKALNFWILLLAMVIILLSRSVPMLIIYAILHGIFGAFESVSTGVIWPNYFGRQHLASIRGMAMTAMVISSSLGPLPFGFAYDLFGGYTQIIVAMMIFPVLGSIASALAPQPSIVKR